ncbi:hypothetical protein pb186bvf_010125 [Paramecium bursaria]
MLKLKQIDSTPTSVTLQIDMTVQNLNQKSMLYIFVYKSQTKLQTIEMKMRFPQQFTIEKLKQQQMYRLQIRLENGQQNIFQTLHVNTKSDPNAVIEKIKINPTQPIKTLGMSEQQLADVIAAEDDDMNVFQSKQEIKQLILKARKNSDARGFMMSEYKVNRPPSQNNFLMKCMEIEKAINSYRMTGLWVPFTVMMLMKNS